MTKQKTQGEGDYEATRRYRKRTDEYLANNDVDKAASRRDAFVPIDETLPPPDR